MVDSVNVLIFTDRTVTIEDISEQLGVSVGTSHKIMYDDFAFSKVSCHSVSPGQCNSARPSLQSRFDPL